LLPDSYGGKFHPRAVPELISSLPVVATALLRRKMTPTKALLHPHKAPQGVKHIFEVVEGRESRSEFNIYIEGTDQDNAEPPAEKVESDVLKEVIKQAPAGGEDSSA
jgi:succinate dehydrogenase / fumarate reductase iron-sulfur subunit